LKRICSFSLFTSFEIQELGFKSYDLIDLPK
jgi:hypothetical protein